MNPYLSLIGFKTNVFDSKSSIVAQSILCMAHEYTFFNEIFNETLAYNRANFHAFLDYLYPPVLYKQPFLPVNNKPKHNQSIRIIIQYVWSSKRWKSLT